MSISRLFSGFFSETHETPHLRLPNSDISRIANFSLEERDGCLNALQDLSTERAILINGLQTAFLKHNPVLITAYSEEVKDTLKQAEALSNRSVQCLQKYINAKPGLINNHDRYANLWEQHRKLDTDEASVISQALENDWIVPPVLERPKPKPLPLESSSGKLAKLARAHWPTALATATSLGLYAAESTLPSAITSFAYYHPVIPAVLGLIPLVKSPIRTAAEAFDLGKSILKETAEIALPAGAVAAAIGYYYDRENIRALPLLATATIAQIGSVYFSRNDPILTMRSLANKTLSLTETWFEYGSLTGIPAATAAAWLSSSAEQVVSTNLSWAATAYAIHFGLSKLIAASRN